MFKPFLTTIILCCLMTLTLHADHIWIEAEDASNTNIPANGPYHPKNETQAQGISNGKWLSGKPASDQFAQYTFQTTTTGKYELFARRFWFHGSFRWRVDKQAWYTVGKGQRSLDTLKTGIGIPACWISLGYQEIHAGEHVLRIETLPDDTYQFNKVFAFDCFVISNESFTPKGIEKQAQTVEKGIQIHEADFGKNLPRTMKLLTSATPQHKTPINILFYGQSIVANSHTPIQLINHLKTTYPNAWIHYKNTAIGGYQAPILSKTAIQDLYPTYPDLLVFHVYGGETGEFEQIIKTVRQRTTAEILTWTHHVDNFGQGIDNLRETASEYRKQIAQKYHCEMADARTIWKEHLKQEHILPGKLLVDQIHLNSQGSRLLTDILTPHFKVNSNASETWKKQVITLDLAQPNTQVQYEQGSWSIRKGALISTGTSPLTFKFKGNKLDVITHYLPKVGSAQILLDGKKPSAHPDSLAVTRATIAPGVWWPTVSLVTLGANAVPQAITMHFSNVSPDGQTYDLNVIGSITGDEGTVQAGSDFAAKSGQFQIAAADIAIGKIKKTIKKDLPAHFDANFEIKSMSMDQWHPLVRDRAGFVGRQTLIQTTNVGEHEVQIIPNGNGPVALSACILHNPLAGN